MANPTKLVPFSQMGLRLVDLEPQFLHWTDDRHHRNVDSIVAADGIFFVCPLCLYNNGRVRAGVHGIICWEPNVPQSTSPIPGRWNLVGTGYADLTLVAGSSSVHLTGPGCGAHFHITNGQVTD